MQISRQSENRELNIEDDRCDLVSIDSGGYFSLTIINFL